MTSNYLLSSVNNLQVSALCQGMGKQNWENKTENSLPQKLFHWQSEFSHVTEIRYVCKKSLAHIFCWYNVSSLVKKALSVIKIPSDMKRRGFVSLGMLVACCARSSRISGVRKIIFINYLEVAQRG